MRISDWSSDVCSSDLTLAELRAVAAGARAAGRGDARVVGQQDADVADEAFLEIAGQLHELGRHRVAAGLDQGDVALRGDDIGVDVIGDRKSTRLNSSH